MAEKIIVRDNSFTNLFPEVTYDKSELTLPILDIWNNLRLVTFPDSSDAAYEYYRLQEGDTLYEISSQFYDTINWWWLIPLVNYAEDPFTFIDDVLNGFHPLDIPAKNIRVLRRNYLSYISRNITVIKNVQQAINERERLEGND
jgi:hypothetical protein